MDREWKLRRDASMPYQDWRPFKPDDVVEVASVYGDINVGRADSFWWGWSRHEMDSAESVIVKARLVATAANI